MTWARFSLLVVFVTVLVYASASPTISGQNFCHDGEFMCTAEGRRTCYPESWKCDGEPDCDGNVDEQGCPPVACGAGEFSCDNVCYPQSYYCDGFSDCDNDFDELSCPDPNY